MNTRLEELRKKRQELVEKNQAQLRDLEEKRKGFMQHKTAKQNGAANIEKVNGSSSNLKQETRFPISESEAINIFSQRQEEKKIQLEEGVMANIETEMLRLHQANEEEVSESSEHQSRDEEDIEKDMMRFHSSVGRGVFEDAHREIKYFTDEQTQELFEDREEELLQFFGNVDAMLNTELTQDKNEGLIEDYLFNLNDMAKDQRRDYKQRQIIDPDINGRYMVNDIIWIPQNEGVAESLTVCYSRLDDQKDQLNSLDYFFGVYVNDKRTITKAFRSEIKRIIVDDKDHNLIYGGIDNGRIAIWDLRSSRQTPDDMTSPRDKIAFMPVIDLKKRDNDIFSVAQEGRIHKYDARKLYEPVFSMDLFVVSESHSIVKLESMPSSLEFDPLDSEILYVTSTEGTIYEIGINQNSFQEKTLHQKVANAPITCLKFMDFKNFFKDQNQLRRTLSSTNKVKVCNYFVTSSFDWNVKFFKDSLTNEVSTNTFHNDFVTSLDVNNQLCPFTYASADVEGKLAVWKIDQNCMNQPLVEWTNSHAISKIRWSSSGLQLAVGDVRGGVNVLSFTKSKLMISDKMMNYYLTNGVGRLMSD